MEVSDQSQLLVILPQLDKDLLSGNMDTLKNFLVTYKYLDICEPDSEQVKEILKRMCVDADEGIKLQCGQL